MGYKIYLSLHCHHQNDSCIKMGSDESHFNVAITVRDKVTRQCPQTTTFEEKGEPKRIRTEVPPLTILSNALSLGQTGSLMRILCQTARVNTQRLAIADAKQFIRNS